MPPDQREALVQRGQFSGEFLHKSMTFLRAVGTFAARMVPQVCNVEQGWNSNAECRMQKVAHGIPMRSSAPVDAACSK
jgi:hypothetical protein